MPILLMMAMEWKVLIIEYVYKSDLRGVVEKVQRFAAAVHRNTAP